MKLDEIKSNNILNLPTNQAPSYSSKIIFLYLLTAYKKPPKAGPILIPKPAKVSITP